MKKSRILIVIAALIVVLIIALAVILLKGKSSGPSITIPSDLEYHAGMSDAELIKNVTAEDHEDGDVSDSLIVESVIVLSNGKSVKITYAAQDKDKNISVKSIILPYDAKSEEATTARENTKSDKETDDTGSATTTAANETTTAYPEETTPVQTESPAAPVLYLTKVEDWIKKGSNVNWVKYVSDITDDKDERNALFQSIMIENYPDINTVGDYDMMYYCKDSDGNFSPKVILHIHVTE